MKKPILRLASTKLLATNNMDQSTQPRKAFVFYRKNYLFGVARPGALVYDGATLACYGNELQPIFNEPVASVTVKEGFGIFKIFVNGKRISILTPVGGETSPVPSEQLGKYLEAPIQTQQAGANVPIVDALSAGAAVVGQVAVVTNYVKGQQGLREFFKATGFIKS